MTRRKAPEARAFGGHVVRDRGQTGDSHCYGRASYQQYLCQTDSKALNDTLASYKPEDSKIQAPVLSIYAFNDSAYFLFPDYMTAEQQAQVVEYFDTIRPSTRIDSAISARRATR
jgi:hypothetical protein